MNYWIFKCNPEKYYLDTRLQDSQSAITWRVTRYKDKIVVGDIAFMWQTGKKRGIRAVMKITKSPEIIDEMPQETQYWKAPTTNEYRVSGTLIHRCDLISSELLKTIKDLENLQAFGGNGYNQGTNFQVTQNEGKILMDITGAKE